MSETVTPATRVAAFGPFEVDVASAELRKAGLRVALQDKPFRLLARLLHNPGELVTREQLQRELWPDDTFVDFERGLNTAVKRLRDALGDEAETPRFIETRPRHGYRFIAPVTTRDAAVRPPAVHGPLAPAAVRSRWPDRVTIPVVAAVAITAVVAGVAVAWRSHARPTVSIAKLQLSIAPAEGLGRVGAITAGGARTNLTISRDGRTVVFAGTRGAVTQLFVRSLDSESAVPLAGTDGAVEPILSPDDQWVAFYANGFLRKIRITGGPVAPICAVREGPPMGASWGPDDEIVFGLGLSPLQIVAAGGGEPKPITALGPGELSHRLPQFLPGGRAIVFTIRKRDYTWGDEEIAVQTIPSRGLHRVLASGTDARYVESGHLVFLQLGRLMACRFDLGRLTMMGTASAVLDGIAQSAAERNTFTASGGGQFSVSASGTLAYARGGIAKLANTRLAWADRQGRTTPIALPPDVYGTARLSPDGRSVALWIWGTTDSSILIYDLERGATTVLPTTDEDAWPLWSPDGRDIWYQSFAHGEWTLRRRTADGSGLPETVLRSFSVTPSSWSPDGRTLAIIDATSSHGAFFRVLTWRRGEAATAFVQSSGRATHAMFSPDGSLLAYAANDSGRSEVYIVPLDGRGPRVHVSVDGGRDVAWRGDGGELYYVAPGPTAESPHRMMVASISTRPELHVGVPRMLFESDVSMSASPVNGFDVTSDGGQFLVMLRDPPPAAAPVTHLEIVLNWFEELKKRG